MATVTARTDRGGTLLLAACCVVLLATIVPRAQAKPFWHDEVYTILEARLPSIATVWAAERDGVDLSPPLHTILVRAAGRIGGLGRVGARSVSILSFLGSCVVLFALVRRRSNSALALVAVLLLSSTAVYRYAYEARGYELVVFLALLALGSWAEAAAGRHRFRNLMTLSAALAAALWTHYYAILILVPIGLGEIVRQVRQRRLDWPMCLALTVSGIAALPLLVVAADAASQAGTFWTRGSEHGTGATYAFVWNDIYRWWIPGAAGLVSLGAARIGQRAGHDRSKPLLVHEAVAGAALLAIPALAVWLGVTVGHGVFVPRYVLFAGIGPAVVAPVAIWQLGPLSRALGWLLLAALTGLLAHTLWQTFVPARPPIRNPFDGRAGLSRALTGSAPVVVTGGYLYLELWYAAPPDRRPRMSYLADPGSELRDTGTDTTDRGYLALQRWSPVGVADVASFLAGHRDFVLYDCGLDWVVARLRDQGAALEEIGRDDGGTLFRVHMP